MHFAFASAGLLSLMLPDGSIMEWRGDVFLCKVKKGSGSEDKEGSRLTFSSRS